MRRDLVRAAAAFNGRGAPPAPRLWLFTDQQRLANPMAAAARLPRGSAVVYRHFGARDRVVTACALARLCRRRGLELFIGADIRLARRIGAHLHAPQRLSRMARPIAREGVRLVSLAWHDAARPPPRGCAHIIVLSPLAQTRSMSQRPVIGIRKAARLARRGDAPVIALGGLEVRDATYLARMGFSGLAGVDAFL